MVNKMYILHFTLDGTHLCMDLNAVKKVLPLVFIEKVPKSSNYLVGFMNFEGKSVPVIDLALRLELKRKDIYSLNTPIILCQEDQGITGIVVDNILGIELIEKDSLKVDKKFLNDESPFTGTIHINNDLLLMLDISRIIDANAFINGSHINEMNG